MVARLQAVFRYAGAEVAVRLGCADAGDLGTGQWPGLAADVSSHTAVARAV